MKEEVKRREKAKVRGEVKEALPHRGGGEHTGKKNVFERRKVGMTLPYPSGSDCTAHRSVPVGK